MLEFCTGQGPVIPPGETHAWSFPKGRIEVGPLGLFVLEMYHAQPASSSAKIGGSAVGGLDLSATEGLD